MNLPPVPDFCCDVTLVFANGEEWRGSKTLLCMFSAFFCARFRPTSLAYNAGDSSRIDLCDVEHADFEALWSNMINMYYNGVTALANREVEFVLRIYRVAMYLQFESIVDTCRKWALPSQCLMGEPMILPFLRQHDVKLLTNVRAIQPSPSPTSDEDHKKNTIHWFTRTKDEALLILEEDNLGEEMIVVLHLIHWLRFNADLVDEQVEQQMWSKIRLNGFDANDVPSEAKEHVAIMSTTDVLRRGRFNQLMRRQSMVGNNARNMASNLCIVIWTKASTCRSTRFIVICRIEQCMENLCDLSDCCFFRCDTTPSFEVGQVYDFKRNLVRFSRGSWRFINDKVLTLEEEPEFEKIAYIGRVSPAYHSFTPPVKSEVMVELRTRKA